MYLVKFSKQADRDKKLLKGAGLEKKAKSRYLRWSVFKRTGICVIRSFCGLLVMK